MNKAEKERRERRQRMLAREQGHTSAKPVSGTTGELDLHTPRRVRRDTEPPQASAAAQTANNLTPITPALQRRKRRRTMALAAVIVLAALAVAVATGVFSASLALLGDSADSLMLYLDRSSGGWPANTGISELLQVEELAGGFVELGAEDVAVYSAYGAKVQTLQPGYARPVLAVGGTRFVVYNRAGSELQVCSRTRSLYTQTFEENILLCAMSNNNSLAVVTESGRYAAQLRVYNSSFTLLYDWQITQSDGTPVAVEFSPDNRRFAAGLLSASEGQLSCSVYFMNTASTENGPVYNADQGSMLLKLDWQTDSRAVAVFDTYLAVIDPRTATELDRYEFGGATLQSVATGRRRTALLLNIRGGNSLITLDEDLVPMAEIPARQAYGVTANETEIYLLCSDAVECYDYDGAHKWTQDGFDARPQAVVEAAETLVFTGSKVDILQEPE